MQELELKVYPIGMLRTNCYVAHLKGANEAILFDPADCAEDIIDILKKENLTLQAILLTHGHFDHIYAGARLKEYYHTQIYAHEEETKLLMDAETNCSTQVHRPCILASDIKLKDNEELELAGMKLKVIHTPGHTSGSVCYLFEDYDILISGDTLFHEDVGATHFPTGNGNVMERTLNDILMKLKDDITVYPGHGEATSIGHERACNPYVRR